MGLDAMWHQSIYAGYEVWTWISYEASVHPFLFLAAVLVIISAFIMYKTEVRSK
jgi:hypothetical protein